jgi:hypothetical protein
MTVVTQPGIDVTSINLHLVPADGHIRALYVTGSPDIQATRMQLAANPGCLEIDQSPVNTALDELADYLDFENGAATLADLAPWARAAEANWRAAVRPGQRYPAIYCSRSSVPDVTGALTAGGMGRSGIGLVIADWGDNQPSTLDERALAAALEVAANGVPGQFFPTVGRQYSDRGGGGAYDLDVFSTPWVENVSRRPAPVHIVSAAASVKFSDNTTRAVHWP